MLENSAPRYKSAQAALAHCQNHGLHAADRQGRYHQAGTVAALTTAPRFGMSLDQRQGLWRFVALAYHEAYMQQFATGVGHYMAAC
jgi:hypothetical protein